MIALMYCESRLCTAAFVFFTCILVPLLEAKRAFLRVLGLVFPMKYGTAAEAEEEDWSEIRPYVSVSRFEDLDKYTNSNSNNSSSSELEEVGCSICLMEFEKEDVVSRLCRCGHVFHRDCIDRWLACCQFTCPLCRSFLLINPKSCHAKLCDDHDNNTNIQSQYLASIYYLH